MLYHLGKTPLNYIINHLTWIRGEFEIILTRGNPSELIFFSLVLAAPRLLHISTFALLTSNFRILQQNYWHPNTRCVALVTVELLPNLGVIPRSLQERKVAPAKATLKRKPFPQIEQRHLEFSAVQSWQLSVPSNPCASFLTDVLFRKETMPSPGVKNEILLVIGFTQTRKKTEPSNFKEYTYQCSTRRRRIEKHSRRTSPSTNASRFRGATRHTWGGLKLCAG